MGKVTVIIASDTIPTSVLYDLMDNSLDSEETMAGLVYDATQIRGEVKVYIMPSDEG